MIPLEIQQELRNGAGLEETLIKHHTNLKTLFSPQGRKCPLVIDDHTYIRYSGSTTFKVCKHLGGTDVHFGSYNTFEDAQRVRDELIAVDWDKNLLPAILRKLGVTRNTKGGNTRGRKVCADGA